MASIRILFATLLVSIIAACAPNTPGLQSASVPGESGAPTAPTPNPSDSFQVPDPTPIEIMQIMTTYGYVDPNGIVPPDLLQTALIYYDTNKSLLGNTNTLSVIDFGAYSGTPRWYIIDMTTGVVAPTYVAHGIGSDPNWTGYAQTFSNVEGSDQTSLGFYITAETYQGEHGLSERLDGLSTTNSNARVRDIVIHDATYVYDQNVKQGRSDGCFAVATADQMTVLNKVEGGSLIYAGIAGAKSP